MSNDKSDIDLLPDEDDLEYQESLVGLSLPYTPTGIVIGDKGKYGHIYYAVPGAVEVEDFKLSDKRALQYFNLLQEMLKCDLTDQLIKWGVFNVK